MLRRIKAHHLLFICALLLIVALVGRIFWPRSTPQEGPPLPLPDSAPLSTADQSLSGFELTESREGRTLWTLRAASAEHFADRQETRVLEPEATLFTATGTLRYRLRAAEGLYRQESGALEVWGKVVLTDSQGRKLTADRLHYDPARQQVWTDGPIRFSGEGQTLSGTGLRYDVTTGRMELLHQVHALLMFKHPLQDRP